MVIKEFQFNPFSENTYVVSDNETGECAIIDAGCYYADEQDTLSYYISDNKLNVKYLLATHLHLDHSFGDRYVYNMYGIGLTAHPNDAFLLENMEEQASMFGIQMPAPPIPISHNIKEGDIFKIGKYTLQAIHVPGHSPGSIVYYCQEERVAFGGDVLFRGSIGRTDLSGGNYNQLITGIREKLLTLPENTVVYSGHGPGTTIGFEKKQNPYLQ
ncbi:MBL fold metallo-hydrolase [Coprobacter sp.]